MAKKVSRPPHRAPKAAPEQKGGRESKQEFDNTNRGVIFPNDKGDNEASPDITGNIDLEIPEGAKPGDVIKFRLAGWEKTSAKSGNTFYSLTVQVAKEGGGFGDKKKKSED